MANNRRLLLLDADLGLKALLQNSVIASKNYHEVLQQIKAKADTSLFLQSIADANPSEVKQFLNDNPELAVTAHGTVTTSSGYTYENISAIELVYVLDDHELMKDMLSYILKLSPEMIKKADTQLMNQMAQVEKQRSQFHPYDFTVIANAMITDWSKSKKEHAAPNLLAQLITDFKPGLIKEGKSWIKEQMEEAFRVYAEYKKQNKWQGFGEQEYWYLVHVFGHLQTLVEKCFEQECSQGLFSIARKKSNLRSIEIKNTLTDVQLNYRGAPDSSLILGENFYVQIISGHAAMANSRIITLSDPDSWLSYCNQYLKQKNKQWKDIKSELQKTVKQKFDESLNETNDNESTLSASSNCRIS